MGLITTTAKNVSRPCCIRNTKSTHATCSSRRGYIVITSCKNGGAGGGGNSTVTVRGEDAETEMKEEVVWSAVAMETKVE